MKAFRLYLPAFISMVLILLLGIICVKETFSKKETQTNTIDIKIIKTKESALHTYYSNVNLYNIDDVMINDINLKDYLKANSIKNLIKSFEKYSEDEYKTIHKYKDNIDIVLVKCKNESYILGDKELLNVNDICL
jgi:hypothetical protein